MPTDPCIVSTLTISSPDRATAAARIFSHRRRDKRRAVCLILPAMGVAAGFYEPFARALADAGLVAATLDLRGQGSSSERTRHGARFGYRHILGLDLPAAVAAMRQHFGDAPLIIAGHSLGGQLATVAIESGRIAVDGLVLIAAGVAHWRSWPMPARLGAVLTVVGVSAASLALPWYPGRRLGFGGDQPRQLMADWRRSAWLGRYPSVPADAGASAAPPRGLACLALTIPDDAIAPERATRVLTERLDRADVTWHTLAPAAGTGACRRHFAWARQPEAAARVVDTWIGDDTRLERMIRRSRPAAQRIARCRLGSSSDGWRNRDLPAFAGRLAASVDCP